MDSRKFPFGTVLTVALCRLVSPDGVGGWHELLDYMTGDRLMNHQLFRAMDLCQPYILSQFPALEPSNLQSDFEQIKAFDALQNTREAAYRFIADWVESVRVRLGMPAELEVSPLPEGVYRPTNPLADLAEMISPDRVIVVEKDGAK